MVYHNCSYVLIAAVAFAGCGASDGANRSPLAPPRREDSPDILLISIDSLRSDHLGCYGYERDTSPTIDSLAAEGAVFRNAVSTTSWTLPAHAAMFTGLYDSSHGVVDGDDRLVDAHVTLAEVLETNGYDTVGFFGGPFLHPTFGLNQGFRSYLSCMTLITDDVSEGESQDPKNVHPASQAEVTGPRTVERFSRWLDSRGGGPFFAFVHLWDVHYDYIPPPEYEHMFDPDYRGSVTATDLYRNGLIHPEMPQRDLDHVVALYDGEIRSTDETIRRLLGALEAAGRLQNTLVVITGDHGDEFFEHGSIGHQTSLFEEVVRIPLIIRWPHAVPPKTVVEDQVRIIDVMPTILGLAGIKCPTVQGRDLYGLLSGGTLPPEPALLELLCRGQRMTALRTNEFKVMVDERTGQVGVFHLATDPMESMPTTDHSDRTTAMLSDLKQVVARSRSWELVGGARIQTSSNPDKQLLRRLKSLGYLGGDADRRKQPRETSSQPKSPDS